MKSSLGHGESIGTLGFKIGPWIWLGQKYTLIQTYCVLYYIDYKDLWFLCFTAQDFRNINLNLLKRLNYLAQLFPAAFNDTKLCEFLLSDLRKWLEQAIVAYKQHLQVFLTSKYFFWNLRYELYQLKSFLISRKF